MKNENIFAQVITYYRQKRIKKILSTYYWFQPRTFEQEQNIPIFSRDAKVHFAITLTCLIVFSIPVKLIANLIPNQILGYLIGLLSAFLAIEVTDYFMLRFMKALDFLFDYFLPFLGLILIVGVVVGVKYFDLATWAPAKFNTWRDSVNEKIQSKPIDAGLTVLRGNNWALAKTENNLLQPLNKKGALEYCKSLGEGWQIWGPDIQTDLDPKLNPRRSFYAWYGGGISQSGGQVDSKVTRQPTVLVTTQGDAKMSTLCVHQDGGK